MEVRRHPLRTKILPNFAKSYVDGSPRGLTPQRRILDPPLSYPAFGVSIYCNYTNAVTHTNSQSVKTPGCMVQGVLNDSLCTPCAPIPFMFCTGITSPSFSPAGVNSTEVRDAFTGSFFPSYLSFLQMAFAEFNELVKLD